MAGLPEDRSTTMTDQNSLYFIVYDIVQSFLDVGGACSLCVLERQCKKNVFTIMYNKWNINKKQAGSVQWLAKMTFIYCI